MKKVSVILIFLFALADAFAQQGIIFKMRYQPGWVYTCTQTINALTQINVTGDKTEMDKILAAGTQLPIILQSKNSLKYTVKTEGSKIQKNFSGIVQYLYNDTKQTVNGTEAESTLDTLKGKKFPVFFKNDEVYFDTVKIIGIPDNLKTLVAAVLNSVKITFPDKALKPGDTFTQDVPVTMPVSGKPITVNTHIVYKLTGMKNNEAFFDVIQTAAFKTHTTEGDININGNGEGHIFFDMQRNFFKVYQNTLNLIFTVQSGSLTMNGTTNVLSVYQTEIN